MNQSFHFQLSVNSRVDLLLSLSVPTGLGEGKLN